MVSPECIIYCEGRPEPGESNKDLGLDAMIYNKIFSESYPHALFVSAGGSNVESNASLALRVVNKAFNGVKVFLLKDMDDSTDKERTTFLDESVNNRMLQRYAIENYLFAPEIVEAFCRESKQPFNINEYNNLIPDMISNNLKPIQQKIKQFCSKAN